MARNVNSFNFAFIVCLLEMDSTSVLVSAIDTTALSAHYAKGLVINWSLLGFIVTAISLVITTIFYLLKTYRIDLILSSLRIKRIHRVFKENKKIVCNIRHLNDLVLKHRKSLGAGLAVSDVLYKTASHIFNPAEGEIVKIGEYVDLITSSLKHCNHRVFAISLCSPSQWLSNSMRTIAVNYLREQKDCFDKHNLSMVRLFVMEQNEFDSNPNSRDELIQLHRTSNVRLAVCDKNDLEKRLLLRGQIIHDFVLFECKYNKDFIRWAIVVKDSDNLLDRDLSERDVLKIYIDDNQNNMTANWSDFFEVLRNCQNDFSLKFITPEVALKDWIPKRY